MRRYMRVISRISIAVLLIALIYWVIIQEPVALQEPVLPQGSQVPLYIPPAVST